VLEDSTLPEDLFPSTITTLDDDAHANPETIPTSLESDQTPIYSQDITPETMTRHDVPDSPIPLPSPTRSPSRHLPPNPITNPSSRRYPTRTRTPSTRLKDYWTLISEVLEEPLTFTEAYSHPGWKEAIIREADSLKRNQTWTVVNRPAHTNTIQAKWIFKTKKGPTGSIAKLKARLVAKGFQQIHGIDYSEIFAPVVRWSTICFILSLAARRKWKLSHMDVVTAFLNGLIKEDIYLEIPEGFEHYGDPNQVLKLNRALYGLKQAPRIWYERIDSWLRQQGLARSQNDPNLYFHKDNKGHYTIVLLYVDDLLVTGDNKPMIQSLQRALMQNFEMSDLGEARQYLGAEFEYYPSGIYLHQRTYIRKLLQKFQMESCKPSKLPMDPGCHLSKHTGTQLVDPEFYRSLVGILIYVTNTRPDVCFAVSSVSRFMDAPEESHLQAAKQILCYLKGTMDFALHMSSWGEEGVYSFADADWGRDPDTRRSTSGLLHKYGESTIHWSSKLQPCVTLSTIEAEYRVLTDAFKDIIYLRHLLTELDLEPNGATPLFSDNQACIRLAENPVLHERTKYIEIQQHFIREKVQSGEIDISFIPTSAQQADFLTKPLAYTQFIINRDDAGVKLLPGNLGHQLYT
jgi:hypothetical protein